MLGAWLYAYYRSAVAERDAEGLPNVGLTVPVCNLLAYLLGPVALTQPHWVAVGLTVTAVLLLTGRERLHTMARQLELPEIITAGKFLILTGIILPLLPNGRPAAQTSVRVEPSNPLELSAAALFAVLFVAISIASTWAADHFGAAGLYAIAAIVGVTDIDPFVLSIAQGGASSLTGADAAVAVLTATASNNLLKAACTVGFTGHRRGLPVVGTLVLLSGAAVLFGFLLTRH